MTGSTLPKKVLSVILDSVGSDPRGGASMATLGGSTTPIQSTGQSSIQVLLDAEKEASAQVNSARQCKSLPLQLPNLFVKIECSGSRMPERRQRPRLKSSRQPRNESTKPSTKAFRLVLKIPSKNRTDLQPLNWKRPKRWQPRIGKWCSSCW